MSAELEISSAFARYLDNQVNIKVEGKTVGECLNDLVRQHPKIKGIIFDRNGKLNHSFEVYINGKSSYPNELTKPVQDGDKLNVVMLIQGG